MFANVYGYPFDQIKEPYSGQVYFYWVDHELVAFAYYDGGCYEPCPDEIGIDEDGDGVFDDFRVRGEDYCRE